jgi:broad specificity phosphatase PhoE
MTRLFLVRHGRASAGWDAHLDPPLDDVGRAQADVVAARFGAGPVMDIVSSPMQRCKQTAAPLAGRWRTAVRIEPGVAEIPSPAAVAMADRVTWLRNVMAGTWADLDEPYGAFRRNVVDSLRLLGVDTVVFSHFIAINAAIGAATGDDRLVIHRLDNCSVTEFEIVNGELVLRAVGDEADTLIR